MSRDFPLGPSSPLSCDRRHGRAWPRLLPWPANPLRHSSPERAGPPHHRCCRVSPSVPPQGPARKARKKKKTTTKRGRRRRRQRAESPPRTDSRALRTDTELSKPSTELSEPSTELSKTEHRALRTASLRTDSSQLTRLEEGEALAPLCVFVLYRAGLRPSLRPSLRSVLGSTSLRGVSRSLSKGGVPSLRPPHAVR